MGAGGASREALRVSALSELSDLCLLPLLRVSGGHPAPHTAKPLLLIFPPPFQGTHGDPLMLDLPQDRLVASGDGGGRLTPLCAVNRPGPNYMWNPGE